MARAENRQNNFMDNGAERYDISEISHAMVTVVQSSDDQRNMS